MEKKQTKVLSKYLKRPAAVCNTIATFVSVCFMWKIRIWTSASVHRDPISGSITSNGCTERLLMYKTKWKHIHRPQNTRQLRSPGKTANQREELRCVMQQRVWKRDRENRHLNTLVCVVYTSIMYNMRVMWSNHGKETARHRFRVLSSSPAYWPNGVALKNPNRGKE